MLHSNNNNHLRNISLVLSYAPLGLVRALSADIARDSILVDTGCVMLTDNSLVDIVLSIRDGDRHTTHRIRARVAGNKEHAIRLAFEECDRATIEALMPYVTIH